MQAKRIAGIWVDLGYHIKFGKTAKQLIWQGIRFDLVKKWVLEHLVTIRYNKNWNKDDPNYQQRKIAERWAKHCKSQLEKAIEV